nr:TrkA C-terminal domain-containing protein [Methyloceanibacter stevinii]
MLLLARVLLPARMSAADLMDEDGKVNFLTELTVCEGSRFSGKALGEIKELNREGIRLLAVHRNGTSSRHKLADHVLEAGDRIVIQATMPEVLTLHGERGFDILGVGGGESDRDHIIVEAVLAPGRGAHHTVSAMRLGRFGVRLLGISRHRYLPGIALEQVQLRAQIEFCLKARRRAWPRRPTRRISSTCPSPGRGATGARKPRWRSSRSPASSRWPP